MCVLYLYACIQLVVYRLAEEMEHFELAFNEELRGDNLGVIRILAM